MSIQMAYLAMIATVASFNYLVLFPINDWLTWGAFPYPVAFLITELTNKFHGVEKARRVVFVGFLAAAILSIWLATPKIAFASASAFLVAQLLDVSIFNRLRHQPWWCGIFLASTLASIVDTVIFWSLAFYGEQVPIVTWALGDFGVKFGLDILMLVPFRLAIRRLVVAT